MNNEPPMGKPGCPCPTELPPSILPKNKKRVIVLFINGLLPAWRWVRFDNYLLKIVIYGQKTKGIRERGEENGNGQ